MRRTTRWIALATFALTLVGCAERAARPAERSTGAAPPAEEQRAAVPTPPPPDSKLAKVTKGMTMDEVVKILGEPSDRHRVTGTAFIPWYFGGDASRVEWHYRRLGRVVLTGGSAFGWGGGMVEWVDYDPKEIGYRR